jgi:ribulose-phosphate 3-epimerase
MVKIAPSILSADFTRLGQQIKTVEKAGAELIHVDVMDGHFVPNLSMGVPVVKSIRRVTSLPLDVHLMIQKPDEYARTFTEAGSDIITFHPETGVDVETTIQSITDYGARPGLALKPDTPIDSIKPFLDEIEVVMLMAVEPGFGGQKFNPSCLSKIKELSSIFDGEIEVDGGVNKETAGPAVKAGATILVAGSAVFKAKNPGKAVKELKKIE